MRQKPFADSCEENKDVILQQLIPLLQAKTSLLEIGSGTGQHAVHFAAKMPHLKWQPTDLAEQIAGMTLWFDEAALTNIRSPLVLDVSLTNWPLEQIYDAAFTANTLHIMSIGHVEACFAGIGQCLQSGGLFISYGPFNYNGQFSSESNARFDQWLKQRDPQSGIRDIEELKIFANTASLTLHDDIEMPVNNRLLIWRKV